VNPGLGLAHFADDLPAIRAYAERDHANIVSWNAYDSGGHYAAHEVPDLLVADIRNFFAALSVGAKSPLPSCPSRSAVSRVQLLDQQAKQMTVCSQAFDTKKAVHR
jgi:hypothetical protein